MANWITNHALSIELWAGALCTFAIYSILYKENKFYRFFEHLFIGLSGGYGVYITWSEVLEPKWWTPMVTGEWWWASAAVVGSMFYFMFSKRHGWISRVIFGLLMGFYAGGIFREFYQGYFPQIASSMKPIAGVNPVTGQHLPLSWTLSVLVFYVMMFSAMSYFFFSFEHKNVALRKTASAGRWFLMIGFGAMFGATVMGRMTLFIGRLNFLVNKWMPEVKSEAHSSPLWFALIMLGMIAVAVAIWMLTSMRPPSKMKPAPAESEEDSSIPTGKS